MWHYTEGIHNWNPIWARHGIRILPGPSSLWFDARGRRFPAPAFPGFDTLGTLGAITATGYDHSWFVLTYKIAEKEFTLSGSEQNPDLTGRSIPQVLGRVRPGAAAPVQAFLDRGEDFVVADTLPELVAGMNKLTEEPLLDAEGSGAADRRARPGDRQPVHQGPTGDGHPQRPALPRRQAHPHGHAAPDPRPRGGPAGRREAEHPHPQDASAACRPTWRAGCCGADGTPLPGLYAAGEVAGFGGGGVHGYRSLEGTFLGGCLFGGRQAGRSAASRRSERQRRLTLARSRLDGRPNRNPCPYGQPCAASHSACSRVSTPSATTSSPIPVPRLIRPSTSDVLVAFAGMPGDERAVDLERRRSAACAAR